MTVRFPRFLSVVAVLAAAVPAGAADPKKPNVVLIVADDVDESKC